MKCIIKASQLSFYKIIINYMNQKLFASTAVPVLVILVGVLGYVILIKKPVLIEQTQINNIVSQNQQTAQSPVASPEPLPTTCVDEVHAPGERSLPPVITSISPISGPVGSRVVIRGCNLAGFEGDQMAIFERSDGNKLIFYGSGYDEKVVTVTVTDNCSTGSETGRYSGNTSLCEPVRVLPGVYKVYVVTWGDEYKSNVANFTVK